MKWSSRTDGVCVCSLTECVWMYVWGDVDVHEKFNISKDGKYTNFNMTMNVFSLAVCSPIFVCVSEAVSGEYLSPESEWERRSEKMLLLLESVKYKDFLVTWPAPNARFTFARDKFLWDYKRADVVEDTGSWLFGPTRFPKLLNLLWRLIIFVSGTFFLQVTFGSYFSRIYHSTCSLPTGRKI